MSRFLQIHPEDNVVVCLEEMKKGEKIALADGKEVTLIDDVPEVSISSILIRASRPLKRAEPPVRVIPEEIISPESSGGVFSRVVFIASVICLTSAEETSAVPGSPSERLLPFTRIAPSPL